MWWWWRRRWWWRWRWQCGGGEGGGGGGCDSGEHVRVGCTRAHIWVCVCRVCRVCARARVDTKPKSRVHGDGGACYHLLDDLASSLHRLDRARGLAHQEWIELQQTRAETGGRPKMLRYKPLGEICSAQERIYA